MPDGLLCLIYRHPIYHNYIGGRYVTCSRDPVVERGPGGMPVRLRRAERRFKLATRDYAQLAAFRHALRGFLRFSEAAAAEAGLTARHYQAMLALRGSADGERLTIADLARQLYIKHNSA